MYINNAAYAVSLSEIQTARYAIFSNLDMNLINDLSDRISNHIECIDIVWCPLRQSFTVKFKKTSMKKLKGFKQDVTFYYSLIGSIYHEFFSHNEFAIIGFFSTFMGKENAYNLYYRILNDSVLMYNLFNVYCLADNIIEIKL